MIKLTDRLKSIAKELTAGESMADIGTDHGFLPLYLWENSVSPHVIMTDINEGPLEIVRGNCKRLHPYYKFDIRQGDGLEPIEKDEVYTIVIAGMGGMLISDILSKDMEKSKSFMKFVLQPRSKRGYLRHFLSTNGFRIKKEKLVREGGYICSVITAVRDDDYAVDEDLAGRDCDDIAWEIPHRINRKNSLYEEYLVGIYNKEADIYRKMKKGGTDEAEIERQADRVRYMKKVLDDERYFYDDCFTD